MSVMEDSPIEAEAWKRFKRFVWEYINGDTSDLDDVLRLFLNQIELLSHVRRSLGDRLRLLGSSEHELLYGNGCLGGHFIRLRDQFLCDLDIISGIYIDL